MTEEIFQTVNSNTDPNLEYQVKWCHFSNVNYIVNLDTDNLEIFHFFSRPLSFIGNFIYLGTDCHCFIVKYKLYVLIFTDSVFEQYYKERRKRGRKKKRKGSY